MVIDELRRVCEANNIAMTRLGLFTFQKNRTTEFCSIVVDWDSNQLLTNYPIELLNNKYNELRLPGNVLLCYKTDLPRPAPTGASSTENVNTFPCCENLKQYMPRRLDREQLFTDFFNCVGSHPNVVFEVKRQVDGGDLLDTTNYELVGGSRREINGNFNQKIHAFKNYKCSKCNLFFSIDLYRKHGVSSNYHHMRLNPFTKNADSIGQFVPREVSLDLKC